MPQISLYVDDNTLKKIERTAKRSHMSLSKFVGVSLRTILEKDAYPDGFFDLFGSVQEAGFVRPPQLGWDRDIPRGKI